METNPFSGKKTRLALSYAKYWLRCVPGQGWPSERSVFSCENSECKDEVSYARVKKYDTRLCYKCYRDRNSINGTYIEDPWIWKHKEKYSHTEKRVNNIIHWMKCQQPNCDLPCVAARAKLTGTFICQKCSRAGQSERTTRTSWADRIHQILKRRHASRGKLLTVAQLKVLLEIGVCGYCFLPIPQPNKSGVTSVDRMDNNLGYNPDNCVPCCKFCNSSKNANTTAHAMLVFMLAKRGNQADAMLVMKQPDYLSGLRVIIQTGHVHIARRLLRGLDNVQRFGP